MSVAIEGRGSLDVESFCSFVSWLFFIMCFFHFSFRRHLFQKASGLARNEGNRLKEVEALRAQVVKYTKDRGWQDKKAQLLRQAKALKKSAISTNDASHGLTGGSGKAAHAHVDPVPERRATDIIYERSLNRMAH